MTPNPLRPKIKKITDSEPSKLKLIHTEVELKDPVEVEKHINTDNSFNLIVFTDLDYKYLRLVPKGKEIQIKIGDVVVWEDSFENYILVDTLKKQKKENFLVISGKLYEFDECLE